MKVSKRGKLGSILFFWFTSFLIVIGLVALMLKIMGMPVGQTFLSLGNKIPVLDEILPEATPIYAQAEEQDDADYWQKEYEKREAELQEKTQQIAELNQQLSNNEKDFDDLEKKILQLENQLDAKQSEETKQQMKQIAKIYEEMSTSKAAALVEVMPIEEATATLMLLKSEQQSGILGGIKDTKKAAEITMLMKEAALFPNDDQLSFDAKIKELARVNQDPVDAISETIAKMPATQSAEIIQSMMATNAKVAMDIMNDVSSVIRSQILAEIAKKDASMAARITADIK